MVLCVGRVSTVVHGKKTVVQRTPGSPCLLIKIYQMERVFTNRRFRQLQVGQVREGLGLTGHSLDSGLSFS